MLRVLLVNDTNKQVGRLRAALIQAGCEIVEEVSSALMIPKKVAELRADVVIIDTESPSRDVLEQICVVTQDAPRPIVMVSEDTQPSAQGGGNAAVFGIGAGQVGVGVFQLGGTPAYPLVELDILVFGQVLDVTLFGHIAVERHETLVAQRFAA